MAIITKAENGKGIEIRGKIGAPSAYGAAGYGIFEYGEGADFFGIYQVRTRFGKRVQVKEKFYTPTNPRTQAQQANRAKYATAISNWKALSPTEKNVYNEKAKYKPFSGINLYTKEHMLSP